MWIFAMHCLVIPSLNNLFIIIIIIIIIVIH